MKPLLSKKPREGIERWLPKKKESGSSESFKNSNNKLKNERK